MFFSRITVGLSTADTESGRKCLRHCDEVTSSG